MRHIHYRTGRYGTTLPPADGDVPPELEPTETKDEEENIFTGEKDTPLSVELRDTGLLEWLKECKQDTERCYTQTLDSLSVAHRLQLTTMPCTAGQDTQTVTSSGFLTTEVLHRSYELFTQVYRRHRDILLAYIDLYRTTPCLPAQSRYTPDATAALCHVICERYRGLRDTPSTQFEPMDDTSALSTAAPDTFDTQYCARFDEAYAMVMAQVASFEETDQDEDFVEVIPEEPVSEDAIEKAIEKAVGQLVYLDQKANTYYYLYLLRRQHAAWHTAQ